MKCVHLQQMRRWKRFNLLDPKAKIRWSGILHWWWPLSSGNRWLEAKGLERIQLDATSFFYKIIRYAGARCLAKTLLDQHELSVSCLKREPGSTSLRSRHLGGLHFHIPRFGYQLRILLIGLEAFFFRVKISLILQFFFFFSDEVMSALLEAKVACKSRAQFWVHVAWIVSWYVDHIQ